MEALRNKFQTVFEKIRWKIWALFTLYLWSILFFSVLEPPLPPIAGYFFITPPWWVLFLLLLILIPGSVFLPVLLDPEEKVAKKHFLLPFLFVFWLIPFTGFIIVTVQIIFWITALFKYLGRVGEICKSILTSSFIGSINTIILLTISLLIINFHNKPILWTALIMGLISVIFSLSAIFQWVFNPLQGLEWANNLGLRLHRWYYRKFTAEEISILKKNPVDENPNSPFSHLDMVRDVLELTLEDFEKPNHHQTVVFRGFAFSFLWNVFQTTFGFSLVYIALNGINPGTHFSGIDGSLFTATWSQFLKYSIMVMTTGSTSIETVSIFSRVISIAEVFIGIALLGIVVSSVNSITIPRAKQRLGEMTETLHDKKTGIEERIASLAYTYLLTPQVSFPSSKFRETIRSIGKINGSIEHSKFWNNLVDCCEKFEEFEERFQEKIREEFETLSGEEKKETIANIQDEVY